MKELNYEKAVFIMKAIKLAGLTIAAGLLLAACGTEEAKIEQDVKKEEQKEKVKAFQAEKQQEDRKVTVQQSTDTSKQHENVVKETVKEEQKAESTPVEQPKVSGLNEAQAKEKVEQSMTAQGQGARNKDVKLSQLGIQTAKDGIKVAAQAQDVHIEAKDNLTRIVVIVPAGTTKERAQQVGDIAARQVASFGAMGLNVDLKVPSKDYLGEYWENFSGDIGIYDSNKKQLVRGYISKLNPTKIKW
ncbi:MULTISPECIES: DUF874 domain-containing protein [Bacillus]|uniref:DUF874 domain-containing protein n=1 Tax=Bacillus thuringiensis TaxID=1428 RepID=A0ABD6SLC7_BACTU|nr:DUF874 domain-containing protein [Bacillus thuringiensis]MCU5590318.1 DUF874 domain-containing protein [Bacillus cereus]PEX44046.1 DUF874 domain-containing protein [Bacillus thuringiensis]PFN84589.1 DUF874 domain-containing protein [Bacillus thuringiensis]PGO20006.1 DUF874 domain-containing protein [Bacillus thuringiensis]